MGANHSSAAGGAVTEINQQTQALINKPDKKEPAVSATILTKTRSHEENGNKKKDNYYAKISPNSGNINENNSRQSTGDSKATTKTNELTATPLIIKSLSNMTNKLVGDAKTIVNDGHHQHYSGANIEGCGCGGKQHVQSALKMCIKGVVKPSAHKSSQQTSAGFKKPHNNHCLLDRSSRGMEDSLERRRKSLQDGDVFIYPSVYKDLNECRKCLRDNRICNCIELELSSDGSSSTEKVAAPRPSDLQVPEIRSPMESSSTPSSPSPNILSINEQKVQCVDHHQSSFIEKDVNGAREVKTDYDNDDDGCKAPVYKISIKKASFEQAPKLILPSPAASSSSSSMSISIRAADDDPPKDENNNNIVIETASIPPNRYTKQVSGRRSGSSCGGSESSTSTTAAGGAIIDRSSREPSDREPMFTRRTSVGETSTRIARASSTQFMSSLGPQSDTETSAIEHIATKDTNSSICNDLLGQNRPDSLSIVKQTSLLSQVNVKQCPTSVSVVSSLTPTKVEKKVTTISIGGSPTQRRCKGGATSPVEEDANDDYIISITSNSDTICKNNTDNDVLSKEPHTSTISIQTRRRNMATKLSGRRAIYEDSDIEETERPNHTNELIESSKITSLVPLGFTQGIVTSPHLERQLLLTEPIAIRDSLSPSGKDSGLGGGVLDYSPILSSVRDYIKNMNTELQVQTSMASPHLMDNLIASGSNNTELDVVRTAIDVPDLIVATPSTIPRSLTRNKTLAMESPIQVVTSSSTGIVQATFTTGLPAASINVQTASSCVSTTEANLSPKKSIFDGASKDEILEYLEDARERVPEILMAADDVMVISENELIVVNQLEPNSPATPISIVETNEVISGGGGGSGINSGCSESLSINEDCSPLMRSSSNDSGQHHGLTHPDKLRQHLEQMYQTSQLAAAAAVDTDKHSMTSGTSDGFATLSLAMINLRGDDQLEGSSKYSTETGIESPDFRLMGLVDKAQCEEGNSDVRDFLKQDKVANKALQHKQQPLSACGSGGSGEGSSNRSENIAAALVSHCGPIMGMLNFGGPIYAGRRNSVSESLSQPAYNCENAMQILAHQKRNTDRNSLSSPPSSPPSSTSPSSSSSSNQTSGNCSAATSFYASSSLSCSSPLLNLHGTFTSSNSPAFNQSVPLPINEYSLIPGTSYTPLGIKFDGSNLPFYQRDNNHQHPMSNRGTPDIVQDSTTGEKLLADSPDVAAQLAPQVNKRHNVDADDSGIGSEPAGPAPNRHRSMTISGEQVVSSSNGIAFNERHVINGKLCHTTRSTSETGHLNANSRCESSISAAKLSRIDESVAPQPSKPAVVGPATIPIMCPATTKTTTVTSNARFSSQPSNQNGIVMSGSRGIYGHYNTLSRLNNYFMNRHPLSSSSDSTVEFQCLDCDQFIDVDQATIMNKTNELRLLRATDSKGRLDYSRGGGGVEVREMTPEQLDRAYVAAMNGLPLCKTCEKKRIERKEIISEFVETELKYGRDLKIMHGEFYRPMQIAGLLTKDQINGVFLNLEELIMAHCKFADRLEAAIREAHLIGDTDFNTVNIGNLFLESAEMLNTFESYCIRQGAAACLLARLAKERELLRIFLRVSQMENTLLRRMNLAAFLMVPVQRVTKYPLLLNRLYKVTAYHHKDREALRDAQLKVELHLEHINQQTKGIGASNKIWRRISSLSAPISNRRGLMNAEDIGYIKLRKTAMDMLKWERDETQFIHSGKVHFAPLTEYLTRQKMKPLRYMPAHALLIVLGRPNWKYRPDLVKANLDSKLMTPTQGGNGIKEAALLLFREKNGRFIPCREPFLLSNCVLSADCSQYNNECPQNQPNILRQNNQINGTSQQLQQQQQQQQNSGAGNRKPSSSCSSNSELLHALAEGSHRSDSKHSELSGGGGGSGGSLNGSIDSTTTNRSMSPRDHSDSRTGSLGGDIPLNSSFKGPSEEAINIQIPVTSAGRGSGSGGGSPPGAVPHSSRSYSLASALPRTTAAITNSTINLSKPIISTASSNLTILNQLMTKVNNYHNRQSTNGNNQGKQTAASVSMASVDQSSKNRPLSPLAAVDISASSAIATATTLAATSFQLANEQPQQAYINSSGPRQATGSTNGPNGSSSNGSSSGRASGAIATEGVQPSYNNYHYLHYNNHQLYGDYEESFEMHERVGKESMLLRADTPLKTRYWLQMLRYHAKDLGSWRSRRNGLPNIMMMRHE